MDGMVVTLTLDNVPFPWVERGKGDDGMLVKRIASLVDVLEVNGTAWSIARRASDTGARGLSWFLQPRTARANACVR